MPPWKGSIPTTTAPPMGPSLRPRPPQPPGIRNRGPAPPVPRHARARPRHPRHPPRHRWRPTARRCTRTTAPVATGRSPARPRVGQRRPGSRLPSPVMPAAWGPVDSVDHAVADHRVGTRAGGAGLVTQLHRDVVEARRIRLGHQRQPSGRHCVRDVVHVRRERRADVGHDVRPAASRRPDLRRRPLPGQRSRIQRAAVHSDHRANLFKVGTMSLTFSSASTANLSYTYRGVAVSKDIVPQVFGTAAASCSATTGSRAALTNYQDMWWNPAESGWGVNIVHQNSTLFATLMTYDLAGDDLWLVMSRDPAARRVVSGRPLPGQGPGLQRATLHAHHVRQPRQGRHDAVQLHRRHYRHARLHGQWRSGIEADHAAGIRESRSRLHVACSAT